MSFDLAVWEGERPSSDAAAAEIYERLMDRLEAGDQEPPTERISAYVSALLDRWPDIDGDAGEDSPWADGPLIGNASGSFIYFAMVWSRAEEASAYAARVAEQHGARLLRPTVGMPAPSGRFGSSRTWPRRRVTKIQGRLAQMVRLQIGLASGVAPSLARQDLVHDRSHAFDVCDEASHQPVA